MPLSIQHKTATFVISLLLAAAFCSIPLHAADESGDTIRTGVDEVRIAFAVSDRDGRAIQSLRSSDVAVADNGSIIRRFRSFRPATASPLDLMLLLDASGSATPQFAAEIAEAKSFIQNSAWGARDRVSILTFGGLRPQLLCAWNCRGHQAEGRLNALRADGDTPLYDALLKAARMLQENRDPDSRPAMILFSDGLDTISMASLADALQAAEELQAPIYAVNLRSKKSSPGKGDEVLGFLASSTGGVNFAPGQKTQEVLRTILEDLRGGYVLTYDLPAQRSGEHSVRLLPTSDAGLQFRSRQAYDDASNE